MKYVLIGAISLILVSSVFAQYVGGHSGIYNKTSVTSGPPSSCTTCILAENSNFITSESGSNLVVE